MVFYNREGVYVLQSNQQWPAAEFWSTDTQLTIVERAFRVLKTTDGQELALRRVARPTPEQSRILSALNIDLPERLSSDRLLS